MTDHHICVGPSSGTRCVLKQQPDPTRLGKFKSFQRFKLPTTSFKPFLSLFLQFPPFPTSFISHPLLYQLIQITSPNPKIPKSLFYWSESVAVSLHLIAECHTCLFFYSSQVCVSDIYQFTLHFCFSISIGLFIFGGFLFFDPILCYLG